MQSNVIQSDLNVWQVWPPYPTPEGIFQHLMLSRSPSLPIHLSPWKAAPTPVPTGTAPLSKCVPSPPASRASAVGISNSWSGWGEAPLLESPCLCTTTTGHPPSVGTIFCKLQYVHACTLTGRILLQSTLGLSLGQVAYCLHCASAGSQSLYHISQPRTWPWLEIILWRSV